MDQRWHGLDRSSFRYAIPVFVLAVVLAVVVPNIDAAVPGGTPVTAGERIGLEGGVAFTPTVGWTLTDGLPIGTQPRSGGYPATAEVVQEAVTLSVHTTRWTGTPADLLGQFESTTDANDDRRAPHVTGTARPFTTTAGQGGLQARYHSTTTDGLVAALVLNGTGVVAIASGPVDSVTNSFDDVPAMLASVTSTEGAQQ